MTFSKTLYNATQFNLEYGELEGTCCLCGEHTSDGHKIKMKPNFTSADCLRFGTVICPYCFHLFENSNNYRRTMFLLTNNEFKPFKKKDIKEIIFEKQTEPYYLYITKTWQKLGFLLMDKAYNTPESDMIKVVCDYDIITYSKNELKEYYDLAKRLRDIKISKTVLELGNFELHHYRKINEAFQGNAKKIINKIKQLQNNPVWDLAIYICD